MLPNQPVDENVLLGQVFEQVREGTSKLTTDALVPLVYERLRKIASLRLPQLDSSATLDPTGFVHEAWIRLSTADPGLNWRSERHFLNAFSLTMRWLMTDRARDRSRRRKIADQLPFAEDLLVGGSHRLDVLALDSVLQELQVSSPARAEIVSLRFFGGLTMPEIAALIGSSLSWLEKEWVFIRSWLRAHLLEELG